MTSVQPMVSASWLKERLAEGAKDMVILDATWDPEHQQGSIDGFAKGHIRGALRYDMNKGIKPRPTCARNLPEADDFREYVRSLGINNNSHVVLYDRHYITSATKIWWTFRVFGHKFVSVLDGGFVNWRAQGYEIETGETKPKGVGNFDVSLDKFLAVEFDEMTQLVREGQIQVVDCRMDVHFKGQEPEPSLWVRVGLQSLDMPVPEKMHAGHMKGAANLFFLQLLKQDSMLLIPKEQIIKMFSDVGVDLTKPLVSCCYMGHTASLINMVACLVGNDRTRLYYGSWTEFGQIGPTDLIIGPESISQM